MFALVGPPIGLLGAFAIALLSAGPVALLALFGTMFVYLFLGFPAAVTGFFFHLARRLLGRQQRASVAVAAGFGATVSWLWAIVILEVGGAVLIGIVGGATAATLGGAILRFGLPHPPTSGPKPKGGDDPEFPKAIILIAFVVALVTSAAWLVMAGFASSAQGRD